ncbi:MAG TPA: hypothetical protein PLX89_25825 [Verrucomicrobiota bacterium]|nr:hypothetical protein [Verrucomicrobiota bacterium]
MNEGAEPDGAVALRRPRVSSEVIRGDAREESDASLRKAGPELRPDRGRHRAPSLPFAWLATALALLAGCSSDRVVPYPSRWPPLPQTAVVDFSALNGRYREKGEWAEPSQASFTQLLFGFRSVWPKAQVVSLQATPSVMQIEIFDGPILLLSKSFTKANGDYSSEDGRLVIRTHGEVVGEGVSGKQTATLQFFPLGDSVVVREIATGSGFSMLAPSKWTSDGWARFTKINAGE